MRGDVRQVTLALDRGADVNWRQAAYFFGKAPLHMAAMQGEDAVARVLLDRGADVNVVDQDNCTPLHYAASSGHESVARLLVDRGADLAIVSVRLARSYGGNVALRSLCNLGAFVRVLLPFPAAGRRLLGLEAQLNKWLPGHRSSNYYMIEVRALFHSRCVHSTVYCCCL